MKKTTPTPAKPRNPIARDLRTPKYKMRVVGNNKKDKRDFDKKFHWSGFAV